MVCPKSTREARDRKNRKLGFTVREETVSDIGAGFVMEDYVVEKSLDHCSGGAEASLELPATASPRGPQS